jgi:hypothetical protein
VAGSDSLEGRRRADHRRSPERRGFLVELTGDFLRFLQTGNVRNYALTFLLGLIALLLFVVGAI